MLFLLCCAAWLTSRNFYPKQNEIGADRAVWGSRLSKRTVKHKTNTSRRGEARRNRNLFKALLRSIRFFTSTSTQATTKHPNGFFESMQMSFFFAIYVRRRFISQFIQSCLDAWGEKNPWEFWFYRTSMCAAIVCGFSQNLCVAGGSRFPRNFLNLSEQPEQA